MHWFGVVFVTFLFILTFLLTIDGFAIQRDKYWMRIWNEFGKPDVKSIKELKAYDPRIVKPTNFIRWI